jgi:hypothetical protein
MKKITFLLLFMSYFAFAQTAKDSTDFSFDWYFGGGVIVNPDYNINANLKEAGVKQINDVSPTFIVGWNATFNRISLSMEFGAAGFQNKKKDGSQFMQVPAALRVHYVAIKKDRFSISAGVNFAYVTSSLSVYNPDTTIDMGDLTPSNNTGLLQLKNSSYFLGPSASLKLTDNNRTFATLTAGYDFAVSNTRWKSDYANIANPVREKSDRIFVHLTIPFLSHWPK